MRVLRYCMDNPVLVTALLASALVGGLVIVSLLRIRRGLPTLFFGCFFVFLAASSSFAPIQVVSKGILRWAALVMLAGASLLYLPRGRERLSRFTAVHWGFLLFMLFFLVFVAAFVTAWYYAGDMPSVYGIIDAVTKLAALLLLAGFLMVPAPGLRSFDGGRFAGFFGNPNGNGTFFAMMLPLFLWRFHYERKTPWRQVWLGIVGATVVNIVLSGSRGAMGAGLIAGVITQARLDKTKLATGVVIVLTLAGVAGLTRIGVTAIRTRTQKLAREESLGTLTHRTEMWRKAWPSFRKSPALGIGFGTSRFVLMEEESAEKAAATIGAHAAACWVFSGTSAISD